MSNEEQNQKPAEDAKRPNMSDLLTVLIDVNKRVNSTLCTAVKYALQGDTKTAREGLDAATRIIEAAKAKSS